MSFVAVMTAASGVSDAVANTAFERVNGEGPIKRISDVCVEFSVQKQVVDRDVGDVDLNIVPAANRRKKLLLADMDSTIISVECIDELADFAGVKAQVAEITERAMQGELDFREALFTRVGLLKGMNRDVIERCYQERVHLNPGARVLAMTMRAQGAMTQIVSGGFTAFADPVAAKAGFEAARANVLGIEDDILLGTVEDPIVTASTKFETLHALCATGGYTPSDVIAVGDGANDGPMVEAAGLGVAYHAKPALKQIADATLDHSDLTALLHLQGIPEAEWVS